MYKHVVTNQTVKKLRDYLLKTGTDGETMARLLPVPYQTSKLSMHVGGNHNNKLYFSFRGYSATINLTVGGIHQLMFMSKSRDGGCYGSFLTIDVIYSSRVYMVINYSVDNIEHTLRDCDGFTAHVPVEPLPNGSVVDIEFCDFSTKEILKLFCGKSHEIGKMFNQK